MKLEEKFKAIFDDMNITTKELVKESIKITEQECIGFKDWCDKQERFFNNNLIGLSIAEKFKLYLKSKENE